MGLLCYGYEKQEPVGLGKASGLEFLGLLCFGLGKWGQWALEGPCGWRLGFIASWDIGRVAVDTMYSRPIRFVGYDIICCTYEKAGAVSCWTTGLASKPSWALSVILVLIEGYSQYECSIARRWRQKYILLTKTNKSHCASLETENRIDDTRIPAATCVR
jgi:hypothetical protein